MAEVAKTHVATALGLTPAPAVGSSPCDELRGQSIFLSNDGHRRGRRVAGTPRSPSAVGMSTTAGGDGSRVAADEGVSKTVPDAGRRKKRKGLASFSRRAP